MASSSAIEPVLIEVEWADLPREIRWRGMQSPRADYFRCATECEQMLPRLLKVGEGDEERDTVASPPVSNTSPS